MRRQRAQDERAERSLPPTMDVQFAHGTDEIERLAEYEVEGETVCEQDVALIVHDLKNPLSTIALETRLVEGMLADGDPADLHAAVVRITQNVAFLDRMIDDLLDSCSTEAVELDRRPTALRALIGRVIDRAIATRDRSRVFVLAGDEIVLSVDELRIERVIANLVTNALKYSPACAGVVVRIDVLADRARVSVIDAGMGISAEESEVVFDKYRRSTSARAHEGSGLGLYVSRLIVEAHGGRIGVNSVRGAGSRFFFELPAV